MVTQSTFVMMRVIRRFHMVEFGSAEISPATHRRLGQDGGLGRPMHMLGAKETDDRHGNRLERQSDDQAGRRQP